MAPADARRKKKHRKRKKGNNFTQADSDNCHPLQQDAIRHISSQDIALQKQAKPFNIPSANNRLPSMGMSVIRQQNQQSSVSGQQLQPRPTSTKSEKKLFTPTVRQVSHGKRRMRHKSSEEEPHETTPSISSSSSMAKADDYNYEYDDAFDDSSIINNPGNNDVKLA